MDIKRDWPTTAKKIHYQDTRTLNFTQLHDCLSGRKLMPVKDGKSEEGKNVNFGLFNIKK
jgi:hypothetical protein